MVRSEVFLKAFFEFCDCDFFKFDVIAFISRLVIALWIIITNNEVRLLKTKSLTYILFNVNWELLVLIIVYRFYF